MKKPKRRRSLRVRNVFISSRMEELAMERQSAFHAVYSTGITPLLFEMEPVGNPRDQINALVDRADLFCGIYYQTIGTPSKELANDLCPIEYELLRFVARFDIDLTGNGGALAASLEERRELDNRMRDVEYLKKRTGFEWRHTV